MSQKEHQAITFSSLFKSARKVLDVSCIGCTFLVSFIILILVESNKRWYRKISNRSNSSFSRGKLWLLWR